MFGRKSLIISVTILFCYTVAGAATPSKGKLPEQVQNATVAVNRTKALALTILKQVKHIDTECRDQNGAPIKEKVPTAHNIIAKMERMHEAFEANATTASGLLAQTEQMLAALPPDDASRSVYQPQLIKMKADLAKYRRAVNRYYERTIRDFGKPAPSLPAPAGLAAGEKFSLHGEVGGSLGHSAYKRPNANPINEASSSDISLNVKGQYTPSNLTNVLFSLNHNSTVRRREIGLTNVKGTVIQHFSPHLTGRAGLDLSKYSDKANNVVNYSELGVFARLDYGGSTSHFFGELKRTSRGYGNLKTANYAVLKFNGGATLAAGKGNMKLGLTYLKKTNETKALDHVELNPRFIWQFAPSGSEVGISYHQFTHPEQNKSPADNNRIKAHLHLVKQHGASTVKWGPEVYAYQFPNNDTNNYYDFKLIRQSSSFGEAVVSARWEIVYRMYDDSLKFDFAQVQYRKNKYPAGTGKYSKFNLAARYYTTSSDKDDPMRFSHVHPPHTLDVYLAFGWMKTGAAWLKRLSIGPVLGTKFYFDTERADAFDENLVEVDYLYRNPQNSARVGFELGFTAVSDQGIRWKGDISYVHSFMYNAKPLASTHIMKIASTVTYPINPQWMVDGYARFHQTRANVKSAADLDKSGVGVEVTYFFDVVQ